MRLCLEPTCPEPATSRGRCPTHATRQDRTANRAGYHIYRTKRWRIVRRNQLANHPLCKCGAIATDVHHLKDIAQGGSPFDPANLESLCHSCHSQETRTNQQRRTPT